MIVSVSETKKRGQKLLSDTFVGIPLSVVRVGRPVALAVTLLGQKTPRHPSPSPILNPITSCKQGPMAKIGLVQVLPDGFGLRMKMFSPSFFGFMEFW